jgi:hypothetical protein
MWPTNKYCNRRQAFLRASDSSLTEALEIRLSEEIMSEVGEAYPLDIEFPFCILASRIRRRGTDCYAVYERSWAS